MSRAFLLRGRKGWLRWLKRWCCANGRLEAQKKEGLGGRRPERTTKEMAHCPNMGRVAEPLGRVLPSV